MSLRDRAGTIFGIILIGAVLLILLGQLLGQPLLLGYVATGSMAPTLEAGDGFVALPPSLTGEIEEGDVVTFDARELAGGGLTTHRVVEVTEEGYITQGDANPFTDQDGDEPIVTDGQIASIALQINGEVVRIPYLGSVIQWIQGGLSAVVGMFGFLPGMAQIADGGVGGVMVGLGVLILAFSAVTDALSSGRGRASRSRDRPGILSGPVVLAVILLLILLPLTASMMIPSGTLEIDIVSSQSPSDDPTVIGVGETSEMNYTFTNNGYLPKVIVFEPASTGVDVSESVLVVSSGETAETAVTVTAPDETGSYLRHVSEYHYLHFLPSSMIKTLHGIHPWLGFIAINLVAAVPLVVVFIASFGLAPIRLRKTNRNLSLGERVKRIIRRFLQ